MSIYNEILNWSANKPDFIRDAIRRLFHYSKLSEKDINEILLILKGECGINNVNNNSKAIPVNSNDIPAEINEVNNIRLQDIKNPININALYSKSTLNFNQDGLTLIYGANGSGKSSYSRILKKICWSRDKNVELKKNVYHPITQEQSVEVDFTNDAKDINFKYNPSINNTDKRLNSIFVFDNKCASIYLNESNPLEYKPQGINILEELISLCQNIYSIIGTEISNLNKPKPQMEIKFTNTEIYEWYQTIERIKLPEINTKLIMSDESKKRFNSLKKSLHDSAPIDTNKRLIQKWNRYNAVLENINNVEAHFNNDYIDSLIKMKNDYITKKDAYKTAKTLSEGDDPLPIGSDSWKELWNAAKEYEGTIQKNDNDVCMLCQQPLNEEAKNRLKRFNIFVQDKTSTAFEEAKKNIYSTIGVIDKLEITPSETYKELNDEIQNFDKAKNECQQEIKINKSKIINFLKSDNQRDIKIEDITIQLKKIIENKIEDIKHNIEINKQLIENRQKIEQEYLSLEAKTFLLEKKEDILKYYNEYKTKCMLQKCKEMTNTRSISIEIGKILESEAINKQQNIFLYYLKNMNDDIAKKISIKKIGTKNGETYQKCEFNKIEDEPSSVLSEGEQKIVALANFLSECTLGENKNSIIFDDPVNSLDLNYREAIAKIIVKLSMDRQVIVLTHDLYFLRSLIDIHKELTKEDCDVIGLTSNKTYSGIISDEIPYLAKNIQERIDTIMKGLNEIDNIPIQQISQKEDKINSLVEKMRQLLEKTAEEILFGKTIQRFNKNVSFKKSSLASAVVTSKDDIDMLLSLYGCYSNTIHDGSNESIPTRIDESKIREDITKYKNWKNDFNDRVKKWIIIN